MKIIIYIIVFLVLDVVSCSQKAEPELYLIPIGFAGKVNILFNKKTGEPETYEGSRRRYYIPSDGVLVTQFKITDGFEDRQYYMVDKNNKRIPLEIFRYEYNKDGSIRWIVSDKNKTGIFTDGISGQYGNNDSPKSVYFEEFIVSSFNELKNFTTKEYQNAFDKKIERVTGLKFSLNNK